jgi:hypothetical protein
MRTKLTVQERIKRATKIREGKEKANVEMTAAYVQSNSYKLKKLITISLSCYVLLSLIPNYPSFFDTQEIVTFNDYYGAGRAGNIIVIDTDQGNEYEIKGSIMGSHAFHTCDTIISQKNLIYKTKAIYHKKYQLNYPIDKQIVLLTLVASLTLVLIMMLVLKDYRTDRAYTNITLATLGFLIFYIST